MASAVDSREPLKINNPEGWGSIKDVVNAPLVNVAGAESWLSVFGMWLLLLINMLQGLIIGTCKCALVCVVVGCQCCSSRCCTIMGASLADSPLSSAWNWWRYWMSVLVMLISARRSRLGLFITEWEAFGRGRYFWQGEGVWATTYKDCDRILKSNQQRGNSFACVRACVPDLFASGILIFLSNNGSQSEWAAIRGVLHQFFLDMGNKEYRTRSSKLPLMVAGDWPNPKIEDLSNADLVQTTVSKCIFYMMFGVWLEDADAEKLAGWRKYAGFFVLPRIVQRFMFNIFIRRVKSLREDTVGLIEKFDKQDIFVKMNDSLPERYRRTPVVMLCDQIMYVVGFAGVGGTGTACESVGAFLQLKFREESPGPKYIDFGNYDTSAKMVAKYKQDPEKYIMEACRLDPPVTSATNTLKANTTVPLAGREFEMPAGMLEQYTLSLANRDETMFPNSKIFDPDRPNLTEALTWNGAFGHGSEAKYPRICPGRYLSLDVTQVIIDHALSHAGARAFDAEAQGGCC